MKEQNKNERNKSQAEENRLKSNKRCEIRSDRILQSEKKIQTI